MTRVKTRLGEDPPPAILVGPDAEREADQRTREDRRADQKAELGFVEAEVGFDLDADNGENRPDREANRKGDRRKPKGARLRAAIDRNIRHGVTAAVLRKSS
jgi:hypothetical protein